MTRRFSIFTTGVTTALATLAVSIIMPGVAFATTWTQSFSDNFNRPNGAVGNNWVNDSGNASIVSNQIQFAAQSGTPYTGNVVYRPASESLLDGRITVTFLAGNTSSPWVVLRRQSAGTEYIAGMRAGLNYSLSLAKVSGGTVTFFTTVAPNSAHNSSHNYQIEASVVGTNPTVLAATTTDLTAGVVVATTTATDSTTVLQNTGPAGLYTFGTTTMTMDDFATYSDVAPATAYTFTGPSSALINQPSAAFTITPNGTYTGTITPSDGGAGGTFSPSSLTFASSSVAQTFTYTPVAIGSQTISVLSNPTLTNPPSLTLTTSDPSAGAVAVNNSYLLWSPYNWHFNGSSWAESTPGGGYVKVAFSGSTLGIGVSTTTMAGVPMNSVVIHAYIDGTTTPIEKTLADADGNNVVTFTSSLSSGNHYAQIFLSKTSTSYDRWNGPASVLRITKIQLASNGSVRSLADTALAKKSRKILIYGDSITEGHLVSQDENAYSAIMAQHLGYEYGQVGFGYLGWTHNGSGNVQYFFNTAATSSSSWRNYDATGTRLVDNTNLSRGFLDGAPDAVFVNMGVNDAILNTGTALMRYKTAQWLNDIRTTIGASPAVFVISPFNFGNTGNSTMVAYKAALLGGVSDYESAHPADSRVYVLDLGTSAYNTVLAHSTDGLHPDDTGSSILGGELAPLALPYISVFSATSSSPLVQNQTTESVTLRGVNTLWTAGSPGSPAFTISGGTGASIISQTISSTTGATLTIDPGSSAGTLVITDPTNNATTTVSVSIDTTPPTVVNHGSSSGVLSAGTTQATLAVSTNKNAQCRYSTAPRTAFNAMTHVFATTGTTTSTTNHSTTVTGLSNGHVRCESVNGNDTPTDLAISFSVANPTSSGSISIPASGISSTPNPLPGQSMVQTQKPATSAVSVSTQTHAPVYTRDLTIGNTGMDVSVLQALLLGLGYAIPSGTTGYFGSETQTALAAYQKANNIYPVTGYFGPLTRVHLNGATQTTIRSADSTTNTPVTPAPHVFSQDLRLHDSGPEVKALQQFLNAQGFTVAASGPGSPGNESSYFGMATYYALVRFQNAHANDVLVPAGLAQGTGYFGSSTREYINGH